MIKNLFNNRKNYEEILMNLIVYNITKQKSDELWTWRTIDFITILLSNEVLPKKIDIKSLIKYNTKNPSEKLTAYLHDLPGMKAEHINGSIDIDPMIEQNHGYLTMAIYNHDKEMKYIVKRKSKYVFKYKENEIDISIKTVNKDVCAIIGNMDFIIKWNNVKYMVFFMENYNDFKENTKEDNMVLMEAITI